MDTGIYQIKNLVSGKVYIGSTTESFKTRWGHHRGRLVAKKHCNRHLQSAWSKYSADVFLFEILEKCEPSVCIEREQYYLNTLLFASCDDQRFHKLGYNVVRVAGSRLGFKHSEETKAKISKAHLGKKFSLATRNRMSQSGKVKKFSNTHKENLSRANKGESNGRAKLTIQQVKSIKKMLCNGFKQIDIANQMNTSLRLIEHIAQGTTWHHVTI